MKQTIYKKDSLNKIRSLEVSTEGATMIQISGLLDGRKVEHKSDKKGTNIGRANERSPIEQAIFEGNAKIKEKLRKGYFKTIEEAQNNQVILPMLAKKFEDIEDKINWNEAYAQGKYDGVRMFDKPEGQFSRTNKLIETVGHIQTARSLTPDLITDGELMAPNMTFQENTRIIKKYRKGETELLSHWVYDSVGKGKFIDRYNALKNVVLQSQGVILAPTFQVKSKADFLKMNTYFLNLGLEGAMLRWGEESYELNKRSKHLLKYKEFLEMDCLIIDVIPNKAIPTQGTIVCQIAAGSFKCGMKMSHAEREDVLINKVDYIGRIASVTYFELTDRGVLRFPVFKGIHLKSDR